MWDRYFIFKIEVVVFFVFGNLCLNYIWDLVFENKLMFDGEVFYVSFVILVVCVYDWLV